MNPAARSANANRAFPGEEPAQHLQSGPANEAGRGENAAGPPDAESPPSGESGKGGAEELLGDLGRLSELCAAGRFDLALDHFGRSQAMQTTLRSGDRQSIEALLNACVTCERNAREHRDALARAIAREQAFSRQLLECNERLFELQAGNGSRASASKQATGPGPIPHRRAIDP